MKKYIISILITLLILFFIAFFFCFKNENKESKEFTILKTINKGTSLYILGQSDSIKFYLFTKDKEKIKNIKKKWLFKRINRVNRCSHNAELYITEKDSIISSFNILIDKKNVILEDTLFCNIQDFFSEKLDTFFEYNLKFNNPESRFLFLKTLNKNEILLKNVNHGKYVKYNDMFRFCYKTIKSDTLPYVEYLTENIVKKFTDTIHKNYPNEDFQIDCYFNNYAKSTGELMYVIDVYCNNSLKEKFSLFKKLNFNSEYYIPLNIYLKNRIFNDSIYLAED